jgi:hypothetical protein
MTEISAAETAPPQQAAPDGNGTIHPADILMHLIVTLLVPMFLAASDGNLYYAHLAALETVTAYRTRTHVDLVAVAQIVAFGFAALGSLSLSFTDDLSLPMILRLRGNANACSRSAEQNRRALNDSRAARQARNEAGAADSSAEPPYDSAYEAVIVASVAQPQRQTQQVVAAAQAQMTQAEPEAVAGSATPAASTSTPPTPAVQATPAVQVTPAVPTPITATASVATPATQAAAASITAPAGPAISAGTHHAPATSTAPAATRTSAASLARASAAPIVSSERQVQAMWAAAMSDVADEFTASIPRLPKAERWKASRRAAALSSCATDLLSGAIPPTPRPGGLGRIMRPNTV